MPTGAELPACRSAGGGIAMEFPAGNADPELPPAMPPTRLRQRLVNVDCKSLVTVEEIETKLREADLRREKYYEKLSSKARAFLRSPPRCSSQEEDHGHPIEAKMRAAEQKRLLILEKSHMRLARLDESRKAAKTGLEMRYKNERVKLETKMESRVQQAEANRTLILKARRQRSAFLRERSSQSLKQRMARESKYKECVRAAIHQKRAAAERKRLEFLEAGKKRARALANSVSYAGEIERMKIKDTIEDRLQRAQIQRAQCPRQKGRLHGHAQDNWDSLPRKPAELLSIKLARYWREFLRQKRTTFELAKAYDTLGINEKSVKSMPFEQLALLVESASTHQTLKALLDRIESRLKVSREVAPASHLSSLDNIDHLLKRVASQKKRPSPASSVRSWETKKVVSVRGSWLSRYPLRVVFCAYMILGHPDAVFSRKGEHEIALARSAQDFVQIFELMIKVILDGPIGQIQCSDQESGSAVIKSVTFRSQLVAFDKAWYTYLNCFVVWKVKDAQSLEEDLVRAACQLEASMIRTCKLTAEGDSGQLSDDLKAIRRKVIKDQRLLREKVQQLSGDAGIEHMECALSETRSKYYRVKQSGSPSTSVSILVNPTNVSPLSTLASSSERNISDDSSQSTSTVVRSLFKETNTQFSAGSSSSGPRTSSDSLMASSSEKLVTENEVLVNEFLHEHQHSFSDGFGVSDHIQDGVEQKIKQTMEKAFWDVILESVRQNQPNYDLIVQLMGEVRDEICDVAPQSWKEDIFAAIDLKILSQVLISGNLDVDYLGKILEFSLVTLQKLSAPATEETMKATHQKLFSQLSEMCQSGDESNNSCVMTLVKGLQFVLEQIQTLKKEISKAHIRLMEPLVKGPAGLDYLRNAFANRYGSPSNANVSLSSTLRCLSSVMNHKDQEWEEHISFSPALANNDSSSQDWLPSTTLRTGGNILLKTTGSEMASSTDGGNASGNQQPECKGEQVDLVVRLSLLKLVTGISGLTKEDLPETLFLNFSRLRSIQAQIQKIIVICTSILICRQILLSENNAVASPVDKEIVVSKCAEQLIELLDRFKDADTNNIVEVICNVSAIGDEVMDTEKLQSRKIVIARMLGKSLQAGDAVFERVFNAVYSALRGVVLGGSGAIGKKIAEMALRKVGAAVLTEMVVSGAEILIVAATISVSVHGPWYEYLIDNI
ncbi:hypothetical protein TanjilG_24295 [Lupinus angustifolius]|uniref:T-complex protein 11 n=1 Tax=Lupinus angustifolius TaxID=3871 RepID=A0A1J7HFR4_LUPAN|nr:hypothetical protein TanjilG_24295 [Lupinus angustifolius]